jgi:hypothetical protein
MQAIEFKKMSPEFASPISDASKMQSQIEELKEICSTWCAPALKKLVFPAKEMNGSFLVPFWTLVFTQTVNLSQVYLNHKNQTTPLFQALKASQRLDNLKKLGLEYISETEVEMLLGSKVQLEEFKIKSISKDIAKMEELLSKFRLTLKVLALGSSENAGKIIISLPKMPELTELGLFHSHGSLIILENFGGNIPKLRSLTVSSP